MEISEGMKLPHLSASSFINDLSGLNFIITEIICEIENRIMLNSTFIVKDFTNQVAEAKSFYNL